MAELDDPTHELEALRSRCTRLQAERDKFKEALWTLRANYSALQNQTEALELENAELKESLSLKRDDPKGLNGVQSPPSTVSTTTSPRSEPPASTSNTPEQTQHNALKPKDRKVQGGPLKFVLPPSRKVATGQSSNVQAPKSTDGGSLKSPRNTMFPKASLSSPKNDTKPPKLNRSAAHAPADAGPSSLVPPSPRTPLPLLQTLSVALDHVRSRTLAPIGSATPAPSPIKKGKDKQKESSKHKSKSHATHPRGDAHATKRPSDPTTSESGSSKRRRTEPSATLPPTPESLPKSASRPPKRSIELASATAGPSGTQPNTPAKKPRTDPAPHSSLRAILSLPEETNSTLRAHFDSMMRSSASGSPSSPHPASAGPSWSPSGGTTAVNGRSSDDAGPREVLSQNGFPRFTPQPSPVPSALELVPTSTPAPPPEVAASKDLSPEPPQPPPVESLAPEKGETPPPDSQVDPVQVEVMQEPMLVGHQEPEAELSDESHLDLPATQPMDEDDRVSTASMSQSVSGSLVYPPLLPEQPLVSVEPVIKGAGAAAEEEDDAMADDPPLPEILPVEAPESQPVVECREVGLQVQMDVDPPAPVPEEKGGAEGDLGGREEELEREEEAMVCVKAEPTSPASELPPVDFAIDTEEGEGAAAQMSGAEDGASPSAEPSTSLEPDVQVKMEQNDEAGLEEQSVEDDDTVDFQGEEEALEQEEEVLAKQEPDETEQEKIVADSNPEDEKANEQKEPEEPTAPSILPPPTPPRSTSHTPTVPTPCKRHSSPKRSPSTHSPSPSQLRPPSIPPTMSLDTPTRTPTRKSLSPAPSSASRRASRTSTADRDLSAGIGARSRSRVKTHWDPVAGRRIQVLSTGGVPRAGSLRAGSVLGSRHGPSHQGQGAGAGKGKGLVVSVKGRKMGGK